MQRQTLRSSAKKVWTSQWSVILRTFYMQILSLLQSSFFFWNFRHRLARELLAEDVDIDVQIIHSVYWFVLSYIDFLEENPKNDPSKRTWQTSATVRCDLPRMSSIRPKLRDHGIEASFSKPSSRGGKNIGLAALRSTFCKNIIPPWGGKDRNTSQVYWDCIFSKDSVGFKEHWQWCACLCCGEDSFIGN